MTNTPCKTPQKKKNPKVMEVLENAISVIAKNQT
jgi:hypothetical protein